MTTPPSAADVRQVPADLTLTIPPEFADENGHMNVRHYYDIAERAMTQAFTAWGVDPQYPKRTGLGIFTVEQHLSFLTEVLPGEQVSVHVRAVGRTHKFAHAHAFLVNDTRDSLAQITETLIAHVSQTTRKTTPWPDDIAAALDVQIKLSESLDWSVPVGGPIALRR